MGAIIVTEYLPAHQIYFELFNRHWIEKDFEMEPLDEFVLTRPEEAILKPGGAMLTAFYDNEPAGVVALRKIEDGVFEFTKMAVAEKFQRKGIAETLSCASFEKAKALGARRVILYTNSGLKPAIALYEKLGFKHISIGKGEYKRSDVKMSIDITDKFQTPNK